MVISILDTACLNARRALARVSIGLLGCLAYGASLADCLKNTNINLFVEKTAYCQTLQILPTHLMDNETLFRSAEAQRDSRMNSTHRLLNNRWLMESKDNTYSGSAALRTVLRMGVLSFWKRDKDQDVSTHKQASEDLAPSIAILNWNNYDLEVSSDKVILGFSYRF